MNKHTMPLKYQILDSLVRFQRVYISYYELTTDQHDGLAFNCLHSYQEKDVRKSLSSLENEKLIYKLDKDHFGITPLGKEKITEFENSVLQLLKNIGLGN